MKKHALIQFAKTLTFIFSISLSQLSLCNDDDIKFAGMMLFANDNEKTYVLLGTTRKDKNSIEMYYESLAGNPEEVSDLMGNKKKDESLYEVALRECIEETRGYLGRSYLLKNSNEFEYIDNEDIRLFKLKVTFFEIKELKIIGVPYGEKWRVNKEMYDYVWVEVDVLAKSTDNNIKTKNGKNVTVHKKIPEQIKKAKAKGWF